MSTAYELFVKELSVVRLPAKVVHSPGGDTCTKAVLADVHLASLVEYGVRVFEL